MKLTSETMVPISAIAMFCGLAIWFSDIRANGESNRERTERIAQNQKEVINVIRSIDQRLSRIEGKLGIIGEK